LKFSFFSHINRRTQFENPVLEAKRKLQQHNMPHTELGAKPLQAPGFRGMVPGSMQDDKGNADGLLTLPDR
jgi:hypothetical protein